MLPVEWIWLVFIFAWGCCIGSFLNVVIYRLPREKSLVHPPSACPKCDMRIRFYDNIPLFSWLILRGKCRKCKTSISVRYFIVELISGLVFVSLYIYYFYMNGRDLGLISQNGFGKFLEGGWIVYAVHVALIVSFLAASAIDLELWVIPLQICWFVSIIGAIASVGVYFVTDHVIVSEYQWFPRTGPVTGVLAAGGGIGWIIALILLNSGKIPQSYDEPDGSEDHPTASQDSEQQEPEWNDRAEIMKELLFLMPIVGCALLHYALFTYIEHWHDFWLRMTQEHLYSGFLGAMWGYFIGCAIVWLTRILGTLAFGREAMGLGDVHLMGAAGAVIGPVMVVIAFFIAPFFGLLMALYQVIFRKSRQIPYGPFLSMAVVAVMIFHDRIWAYLHSVLMPSEGTLF